MLICSIEKSSLNRSDILSSPVAFMSSLLFPPSDLSVWHHKHTLQDTLSRVSCSIMHTKINTNHSPSKDDLVTESESQPSVLARITIRPQSSAKELFSKHKKRNKPPFQEYCKKKTKKPPKNSPNCRCLLIFKYHIWKKKSCWLFPSFTHLLSFST